MNLATKKNIPATNQQILEFVKEYETPFYIYDEKGIREGVRKLTKAFAWAPDFKEYFAVKACPIPGIIQILKEEGCGIGNVSKAHYLFGENKAKYYLLTDIDNTMLMLAYKNLEGIPNKTFVNENILDECVYEKDTLVITHGVLEHFSDENIAKIMAKYNNDRVKFHGHYVPLDGYLKPSFGDERLLSAMDWIHKINPSSIEMMNNEDLFMYF